MPTIENVLVRNKGIIKSGFCHFSHTRPFDLKNNMAADCMLSPIQNTKPHHMVK